MHLHCSERQQSDTRHIEGGRDREGEKRRERGGEEEAKEKEKRLAVGMGAMRAD